MHKLYCATEFRIEGSYTLWIKFDDGSTQVIDFEPVLFGYYHGPLCDPVLFNQVKIDPYIRTLVWPNGADFDPETLRNWPQYRQAWIDAAKQMETTRG
jgi:hypothetical protein